MNMRITKGLALVTGIKIATSNLMKGRQALIAGFSASAVYCFTGAALVAQQSTSSPAQPSVEGVQASQRSGSEKSIAKVLPEPVAEVARAIGATIAEVTSLPISQPKSTPLPLSAGQKAWIANKKLIMEVDRVRLERLHVAVNDVDRVIRESLAAADYETFADNVLGIGSKLQMVNGQSSFRSFLTDEYKTHIFSPNDLALYIKNRGEVLSQEQAEISNLSLINLKIDTSSDFETLSVPPINLPDLNAFLQNVVDASEAKAWESVESFTVSMGAGMVAGSLAQEMLIPAADPNADPFSQLLGSALSFMVNVGAGLVTDAVVNEVYETDKNLISELKYTMEGNLLPLLSTGTHGVTWRLPYEQHVLQHRDIFMDEVCKFWKLDRASAEQNLAQ